MNVYDLFQLLGGIILTFSYPSQIIKIIKTKSVEDLSLQYFIGITLGVAMMEVNAVHLVLNGSALSYLITNTAALIMPIIVIGLILKYKNKEGGYIDI